MDQASCYGHLGLLQALHAQGCNEVSEQAMDGAAAGGHLGVVKWLHASRGEGCTAFAMDGAAAGGHLEVMEWCHSYLGTKRKIATDPLAEAAEAGHEHVVRWIERHFHPAGNWTGGAC
mmetsp:Transcript_38321/g.59885  ORF Transcript_38321/g.59885 Transcript_38321/m.59885 type:complete len:118 (+) Transcript_38321:252-605(+)